MAKFRGRIMAKAKRVVVTASLLKKAAMAGTDIEKQRAIVDGELDSMEPEKQYLAGMKVNAMLKLAHKDPCHVGQHEDCIDETCDCKCHVGQHFVQFKDRFGPNEYWAWMN